METCGPRPMSGQTVLIRIESSAVKAVVCWGREGLSFVACFYFSFKKYIISINIIIIVLLIWSHPSFSFKTQGSTVSSAGSGHKEARGVQVWGTRRENTRRNEEVVQMWGCLAAFQGCSWCFHTGRRQIQLARCLKACPQWTRDCLWLGREDLFPSFPSAEAGTQDLVDARQAPSHTPWSCFSITTLVKASAIPLWHSPSNLHTLNTFYEPFAALFPQPYAPLASPLSSMVALAASGPTHRASSRVCTRFPNEAVVCFLASPTVYKIRQENQTPHCSQYLLTFPNQMFMSLNTKLEEKGFLLVGKWQSLSSFRAMARGLCLRNSELIGDFGNYSDQLPLPCMCVCAHGSRSSVFPRCLSAEFGLLLVYRVHRKEIQNQWFKNHPLSLRASMPSFSQTCRRVSRCWIEFLLGLSGRPSSTWELPDRLHLPRGLRTWGLCFLDADQVILMFPCCVEFPWPFWLESQSVCPQVVFWAPTGCLPCDFSTEEKLSLVTFARLLRRV